MTSQIPRVSEYMTPMLHCVNAGATVADARQTMESLGIHHLPVLKDGALFGVLSDRDMLRLSGPGSGRYDSLPVEEVCSTSIYAIPKDARLDDLANDLVLKRVHSAIVVEAGRPIGIFTTLDALRALADCYEKIHAGIAYTPLV